MKRSRAGTPSRRRDAPVYWNRMRRRATRIRTTTATPVSHARCLFVTGRRPLRPPPPRLRVGEDELLCLAGFLRWFPGTAARTATPPSRPRCRRTRTRPGSSACPAPAAATRHPTSPPAVGSPDGQGLPAVLAVLLPRRSQRGILQFLKRRPAQGLAPAQAGPLRRRPPLPRPRRQRQVPGQRRS